MGALDLSLGDAQPVISGTLAFDTLDLRSFLSAFTPLGPASGAGPSEVDTNFADRVNLDLRLSAAHATAGSIQLADVAATAQVKDGLSVFDISDASAFGGNIQSSLRFDRKPEGSQVEIRLLASDIDGGAFGTAAGMTRLVPVGTGTVSVILKGPAGPGTRSSKPPTARFRRPSGQARSASSTCRPFSSIPNRAASSHLTTSRTGHCRSMAPN